MSTSAGIELKRTPLYAAHKAAGARLAEFGGWEMPIEYGGIVAEHLAVRTAAGLFDVSHMGEIEIRGPEALRLVQWVTCNDASRLQDHQAQYTALMHPRGSAVDDCIVHRFGPEHYFLCVNAANTDKDLQWILQNNHFDAQVRNVSADYAQLALQGPKSAEILATLTGADLTSLRPFWFRHASVAGAEGVLARTGYTGEDGFEFYLPAGEAERVWPAILEAGQPAGLVPVGLGARNTLRLEAAYPLYGHELDEQTTLLEANLAWIVKFEKGDFIGRDALVEQRARGTPRKLIGFEMAEPGLARDGYEVKDGPQTIGRVTSGSYAPFLRKGIGMAYVPAERAAVGREIEIEIRGKRARARQVALPFYRRPKISL